MTDLERIQDWCDSLVPEDVRDRVRVGVESTPAGAMVVEMVAPLIGAIRPGRSGPASSGTNPAGGQRPGGAMRSPSSTAGAARSSTGGNRSAAVDAIPARAVRAARAAGALALAAAPGWRRREVARLQFSRATRTWSLEWRDGLRWRRYSRLAPTARLEDLLGEIREDACGLFWRRRPGSGDSGGSGGSAVQAI